MNAQFFTVAQSVLLDCVSSRFHSHDFDYYRSELLIVRVRLFAALFGLATPLWIPIDRWLLPTDALGSMMALRLITGLGLLLLALLPVRPTLNGARIRVFLLVAITLLFYLAVQLLAGPTFPESALIGYTVLPLLLIAILALLPLTLAESAFLQLLVAAWLILLHTGFGVLLEQGVLGLLWLLLLFIGFALMAQGIQLHLLLLIHRQATRDNLTGLFNRGALLREAAQVINRGREQGLVYSVLMIDLDRFKQINDTYGHLAGDNVLRTVSSVLAREASPGILPGRFGGEEFLLLLADTPLAPAKQKAEQLRLAIADLQIDTETTTLSVTTSIGVAEGAAGEALEEVIQRADQALYTAKEKGRNLVVS